MVRPGNEAKGIEPSFRAPKMQQTKTPDGRTVSRPVDNNVVTPGLSGPGYTIHESPNVLRQESANMNAMGGTNRDFWQTTRQRTGESNLLQNAMPVPIQQQASREFGGGYARAWQPRGQTNTQMNRVMAADPAAQATRNKAYSYWAGDAQ
jgi:hypothetical protein